MKETTGDDGAKEQTVDGVQKKECGARSEVHASRGLTIAAVLTSNLVLVVSFLGYIVLFCFLQYSESSVSIGYGPMLFNFLYERSYLGLPLGFGCLVIVLALLLLDIRNWSGWWLNLLAILLVLLCAGMGSVAFLLATGSFEFAPLAFFFLFVPAVLVATYVAFFRAVDRLIIVRSLFWTLTVLSIVALGFWLQWLIVEDKGWNSCTKIQYYELLKACTSDKDNSTEYNCHVDETIPFCTTGFIIWIAPFILILFSITFAAILHFLVRAERAKRARDTNAVPVS